MPLVLCSSELLIRPVTQDDLDQVLEVYRQCEDFLALGPVARASMQMVLADLKLSEEEHGIFCGIYQPDGRMIGVVDFVPSGFEGVREHAYLSLLMIAQPYRCAGLGAAVVRCVEDEILKDQAITAIRAGVQVNNPKAIRFWQRQGYQIVSGPHHLPDQTTCFDLFKPVRALVGENASGKPDSRNPL